MPSNIDWLLGQHNREFGQQAAGQNPNGMKMWGKLWGKRRKRRKGADWLHSDLFMRILDPIKWAPGYLHIAERYQPIFQNVYQTTHGTKRTGRPRGKERERVSEKGYTTPPQSGA